MDFDDITLGEIEEIENYANASITELGEATPAASRLRTALAWIIKRRSNPQFTIDDARKLTAADLNELLDGDNQKKG